MNVVYKTEGSRYIEWENTEKSIIFGDDDLSINLKNRQKDVDVVIDVCATRDGDLVIGAATGYRYIAQVEIPAKEYIEVEQDEETVQEEVPWDIDKCTLYLYAMEV